MKKIILLITLCLLCICISACGEQNVPETIPETVPFTQTLPTEVFEPTEEPTHAADIQETIPTEPELQAEQIIDGFQILIDGVNYSNVLSDDSYWSKRYVRSHQQLAVESQTAFSAVYIEWDELPGSYSIVWDGGSVECGQNGFFHEYIRLPEPVNRAEIEFTSGDVHIVCDIDIFTEGRAPDGVQDWLPPCEEADILVFPTHSDDDALFFGPLISYYAIERELTVQTAFMVEHHGYPERNHERLNGLWEMGVRHYPILGTAPDTATHNMYEAMNYYAASNIEQWQVEQIRRFKPLVAVGHDLEGEYGNAGHKVNACYLVTAVEAAADETKYPESAQRYGLWETPKLYLHLYEENEIILDVNVALENDPEGRTPFEIATEAFQCHASQIKYGFRVQQNEWRANDCRPFGLYRTLVGYDTVADIMENVDPEQWR